MSKDIRIPRNPTNEPDEQGDKRLVITWKGKRTFVTKRYGRIEVFDHEAGAWSAYHDMSPAQEGKVLLHLSYFP